MACRGWRRPPQGRRVACWGWRPPSQGRRLACQGWRQRKQGGACRLPGMATTLAGTATGLLRLLASHACLRPSLDGQAVGEARTAPVLRRRATDPEGTAPDHEGDPPGHAGVAAEERGVAPSPARLTIGDEGMPARVPCGSRRIDRRAPSLAGKPLVDERPSPSLAGKRVDEQGLAPMVAGKVRDERCGAPILRGMAQDELQFLQPPRRYRPSEQRLSNGDFGVARGEAGRATIPAR